MKKIFKNKKILETFDFQLTTFNLFLLLFVIICLLLVVSCLLLVATPVLAQIPFVPQIPIPGMPSVTKVGERTLADYISSFYQWSITAIAIITVVVIMISGLQWIMAGGNPPTIQKAREQMMSALIGLVLALLAIPILRMINPALVRLETFNIPMIIRKVEPIMLLDTLERKVEGDRVIETSIEKIGKDKDFHLRIIIIKPLLNSETPQVTRIVYETRDGEFDCGEVGRQKKKKFGWGKALFYFSQIDEPQKNFSIFTIMETRVGGEGSKILDRFKSKDGDKISPCYPSWYRDKKEENVLCFISTTPPLKLKDLELTSNKKYKIETSACPQVDAKDQFFQATRTIEITD